MLLHMTPSPPRPQASLDTSASMTWMSVPAPPARMVPSAWTDPTLTPACAQKVRVSAHQREGTGYRGEGTQGSEGDKVLDILVWATWSRDQKHSSAPILGGWERPSTKDTPRALLRWAQATPGLVMGVPGAASPDSSRARPSRGPGYTGMHCEVDIDECDPDPCHYGSCKDGVATFTCLCRPGYTGHHCETNINECSSQPCRHGGTCQDRDNAYLCFCLKGTTGGRSGVWQAGGQWVGWVRELTATCHPFRTQLRDQPGRLCQQPLRLGHLFGQD